MEDEIDFRYGAFQGDYQLIRNTHNGLPWGFNPSCSPAYFIWANGVIQRQYSDLALAVFNGYVSSWSMYCCLRHGCSTDRESKYFFTRYYNYSYQVILVSRKDAKPYPNCNREDYARKYENLISFGHLNYHASLDDYNRGEQILLGLQSGSNFRL